MKNGKTKKTKTSTELVVYLTVKNRFYRLHHVHETKGSLEQILIIKHNRIIHFSLSSAQMTSPIFDFCPFDLTVIQSFFA